MNRPMQTLAFDPTDAQNARLELPITAAVFALYGEHGEPYVGRTPNLRARLRRLLQPSPQHPRRLQLAGLVRRIEWQQTGSEFESLLVQFALLETVFGAKALERMHLKAPAFVRYLGSNRYPRLTVTHRPHQREQGWAYGPFASNAAAERYAEEVLKLFLLRRCTEDLEPAPDHPGCVYGEMKMCLAPCQIHCTDEHYGEESAAVEQFLAKRGEARLGELRTEREQASAQLDFERAAALHAQVQRVEGVVTLAAELVRPLNNLRAVVLQASTEPEAVSVFLFEGGLWRGPVDFSTLGMRIQNEHSGSTSLFAHPIAIAPVPEAPADAPVRVARDVLEARIESSMAALTQSAPTASATLKQGHLALLTRWYYRALTRRQGEVFFADDEGNWPLRAMVRGVGRVAASSHGIQTPPI